MVRDLRREPPRRWSEQVGGIRWLPRLIDKTRCALQGTLGSYLFGQSPVDRALLERLGLSHRDFAEIVAHARDDDAVLAELRARDPKGVARARAWSDTLPQRSRIFLFMIDVDDGYVDGGWRLLKGPANVASAALTWTMKRLWPSGAARTVRDASRANDANEQTR